jgi:hypothetical protein
VRDLQYTIRTSGSELPGARLAVTIKKHPRMQATIDALVSRPSMDMPNVIEIASRS